MTEKHFVVATAGHVDHGKSALVKALTGTDPDRLPEEKAREITIDLGFAHLKLPTTAQDPNVEESHLSISFIDVPGHEDFVRNMIAGLGSIDLVLLVVAADDGWMPQTEEHLQIVTYLGIDRIVVALNKSDIGQLEKTTSQIKEQLSNTPFADAPIIPISARSGQGIGDLKKALGNALADAVSQRDISKTRLLVDRAFNLTGIGTVVTGTLTGGTIRAGQTVYVQPGNFKARARSLQAHRENVIVALPGMRTGVNLAEDPKTSSTESLRRGCVLTTEQFEPSTTVDVRLEKSARLQISHPAARPLKSGTSVFLHHGTGRTEAMLVLAEDKPLQPGKRAIAQLRLASPVLTFIGDRFVVRDRSEQYTIAGGRILDPNGNTKGFRTPRQQRSLTVMMTAPDNIAVYVESALIRHGPIQVDRLLRNSNFSHAEVEVALNDLQRSGRLIIRRGMAVDMKSWQILRQFAIDAIERAHKTNSEQKGLELADLRSAIGKRSADVTEALIEELCDTDFVRRGSIIARASHRPRLPAHLEATAKWILDALAKTPLDPPGRSQIAPDIVHQQALRYLIDQGEVIELGPELFLSRDAFVQGKDIVTGILSANGAATVSELREALHTSRRVAVPLLERFDRDRVTCRVGDRRVLFAARATPGGPIRT